MKLRNGRPNWAPRRALCVLCALCLSVGLFFDARATDEPTPAYYETVTVTEGVVISDIKANIRKGPGQDYGILTHLGKGEVCRVLGEEGEWYHILLDNGREGYIRNDMLETYSYEEQEGTLEEEPLAATLTGFSAPHLLKRRQSFALEGEIASNVPLVEVLVTVTDLRTGEVETSGRRTFDRDDDVREYSLERLNENVRFRRLSSGDKRLKVEVRSESSQATLAEVDFYVLGGLAGEMGVTEDCAIISGDRRITAVRDGEYDSAWMPKNAGDELEIRLPEGIGAEGLLLEWTNDAPAYEVELYNADGASLDLLKEEGGGMLSSWHETHGAERIVLRLKDTSAGICELRVYEQNGVPDAAPRWEKAEDPVDMLVVVARPGEEFVYFGNALADAASQGKRVAVLYMTGSDRELKAECMEALWTAGVKIHPLFLGRSLRSARAYEEAIETWGLEETYEDLVSVIRRLKPNVVLTHDIEGEGGDNYRKLTSATVRRAVLLAPDADEYPNSVALYGAWDVKKTYIHLYEGNMMMLDVGAKPSSVLGWTVEELTAIAFGKYQSLDDMELSDGEGYNPNLFGLIRTNVGDDIVKASFFENLD